MSIKKISIRVARKVAIIGNNILTKGVRISAKVENKATRILDGVDYSLKVDSSIPLEKIYYNSIPHIIPLNPAMPAVGSDPSVTLLLPTLDGKSFFGGTATALVVAAKLALHKKRKLKIIQTLKTGHPKNLEGFFEREGIIISNDQIKIISVADRAYNRYGYVSMHPDDIFIASAWWDAHLIDQLPLQKKYIYLIQDFEPIFYNNSDMYILAEETYKSNKYIPLCNTELMLDFMKDRKYPAFQDSNSYYFEPAVSRIESGLVSIKAKGEKKVLFLYGRPDVHRNLFFTALDSINHAFKSGFLDPTEWTCYMAGQDGVPDIELPCRVKIRNLGKMNMAEYVSFSKTVDIAVSPMMAPHPNYPTLEFASIGSAVVTTKYANKQVLKKYSTNIFMSDIDVESMAGAINLAAKSSFKQRIKNVENNTINSKWSDSLDEVVKSLASSI